MKKSHAKARYVASVSFVLLACVYIIFFSSFALAASDEITSLIGQENSSQSKSGESRFDEAQSQKLSQSDFLGKLRATHPVFVKDSYNHELALQEVSIQNAGQEWELQLRAQQAHQEQLLVDFGPTDVDQSLVGASIGRQIWKTGAFLSFDAQVTNDDNDYNNASAIGSSFSNPTASQKQQLSVTVSQPLLKNYKGSQSRLAYNLSQENVELSAVETDESQEDFLVEMSDQYLNWVLFDEEVKINAQRLDLATRQKQEIEKRYRKNLVEKVDLLRSQGSERLAKQQLLLSRSQLNAQVHSLARLSNLTEMVNQTPDFAMYDFPKPKPLAFLKQNLQENSRQIQILKNQYQQLSLRLDSVKNSTKPELNLDLQAALKSENQDGLAAGNEDSDDGQDYSIGLSFKKSLGNNSAKGQRQQIQIQMTQLLLDQQYVKMQLEANLYNLYIQLEEMQNILLLNRQSIDSARETAKEELAVYEQGRSDYTNVILSRDEIKNFQLIYAKNAITYHRLYLQLQSLTDQIFVNEEGES